MTPDPETDDFEPEFSGSGSPLDDRLDEALEESFPASDPPAIRSSRG